MPPGFSHAHYPAEVDYHTYTINLQATKVATPRGRVHQPKHQHEVEGDDIERG